MSYQWPIAVSLHQLGTLIWVGGMFFAHFALRPAANRLLDTPKRLTLMMGVFDRFFVSVWVSILLLWTSGIWIFLFLSGGSVGMHVHAMMGIAGVMTAIFTWIWFSPYRGLKAAVDAEDWAVAGGRLAVIRRLIGTNLLLGLFNAVLGAAGPGLLAVAAAT